MDLYNSGILKFDLKDIFSYIAENENYDDTREEGEGNSKFIKISVDIKNPYYERKIKNTLIELINGCRTIAKKRYSIDDVLEKFRKIVKHLEKANINVKETLKLEEKDLNELKIDEVILCNFIFKK